METYRILIVSGCPHATTRLYRCIHLQEQFSALGHDVVLRSWDELEGNERVLVDYDLVVLQRVPMTRGLRRAIEQAQPRGTRIIFDTDDLVFEPALVGWHRAVQMLSPGEQRLYIEGVRRYQETLQASDWALASTPLLAELARNAGARACVHRNGLGQEMTALAERLCGEHPGRPTNGRVVLGYGSGTATHDVDFQEAVPALLHVLARYPHVELLLVGPLQLPPSLHGFAARIRHLPLMDWRNWLATVARFDVNLAPLERGNLFCRAKSEIKVLEAAAVGVPTVASRIDPYEHAIQDGETGLLAGDTSEWIVALEALIESPQRRRQIGVDARRAALARAGPATRTRQLASILETICTHSAHRAPGTTSDRQRRTGDFPSARPMQTTQPGPTASDEAANRSHFVPLTLNWLVSEPIVGSGGFTTIFRLIDLMAGFGHTCRVYVQPVHALLESDDAEIARFITSHFDVQGARFYRWRGWAEDADATIATYWETAHVLASLHNGGRGYYLVQDFEPAFYPVGTRHIRAEETYRLGLHCITIGRWLAAFLAERYDATTDFFDFAVDTDVYFPRRKEEERQPRLIFYARPSTPRRGYELGVEALCRFHAQCPDVEILFYGADDLPGDPGFPIHNVGVVTPHELASLFSNSDVGLVLSLTNPSLTPYEMMACRCAVVDIDSERVVGMLRHEENCLLAQPASESISEQLIRLFHDPELRQRLVEQAYAEVRKLSWEASARQFETILLRHASPETRVAAQPSVTAEADALLWQIHEQLDRLEAATPIDRSAEVEALLDRMIEEKAHLAVELDTAQAALHRHVGQSLARRGAAHLRTLRDRLLWNGWGRLGGALVRQLPVTAPIRQHFVADRARLCRVELLPAPTPTIVTRPLVVRLHTEDGDGVVVTEQVFRSGEVAADKPLAITFDPLPDSYGRAYTLELSSPGATVSDHHRLWCYVGVPYPEARLEQDGKPLPGQLAFRYLCGEGELLPARAGDPPWTPPVTPLPNRWQKRVTILQEARRLLGRSLHVWRTGGPRALVDEVRAYLRWRFRG